MSRWLLHSLSVCVTCLEFTVAGCTTWHVPADVSDAALRGRAVTVMRRDVQVSAAILSVADTRQMFGSDLDMTEVQPVWIEVRNNTSQPLRFLRSGADPDYYSPREVAWSLHTLLGGDTNARIDNFFEGLSFQNPIAAGEAREGILMTNPDRNMKLLNVDLLGTRTLIPFTLFLPVPDGATNQRPTFFRYPETEVTSYTDLDALRAALQRLPSCATDATGATQGDPLNVVFVGELADIGSAVRRRDYRREVKADDMAQRVFGRPPDVVLRKEGQARVPSNWLRGWLAPMRFDGRPIYVAQTSRPVGGRFASSYAKDIVLDANVDDARNLLIQDMVYSGGLEKIGFVAGVGEASAEAPRSTFHGAHYHTDGLRAVLFFATRPLSIADVEFLNWVPYLDRPNDIRGEDKGDGRRKLAR